jgi:hypothetical protein
LFEGVSERLEVLFLQPEHDRVGALFENQAKTPLAGRADRLGLNTR